MARTGRSVALAALATWLFATTAAPAAAQEPSPRAPVGSAGDHRTITPVNQILTPAGRQVELPGLRPQAVALSPDGRLLVTAGKTHALVVIDPLTGRIRQQVPLPSDAIGPVRPPGGTASAARPDPDEKGQLSYTGLLFSPDGARIYLSNVEGTIKVFGVDPHGDVKGLFAIALPPANAPRRTEAVPAGLAISADGSRVYVVLNLANRLAELDAATGRVLRTWETGVAPYDVVLSGAKAYVSNWGGRRPDRDSVTGPAGKGTRVRVDPVRHIANEGSVTVIDLAANRVIRQILVGLHASAIALHPDGKSLVVANAASDTLSVIDTRRDRVVETVCVKPSPAELFGASPNALAFAPDGKTLYVANGTQNAVAVIRFQPGTPDTRSPDPRVLQRHPAVGDGPHRVTHGSKLVGLIPVGWFPGAVVYDAARGMLYVANIKGIGSTRRLEPGEKTQYNSRNYFGTLSLVPLPSEKELQSYTARVYHNYRRPLLEKARRQARPGQPPRPVPERVGEPSVFEHVVYIIKENRTYDQVLGDVEPGNGDPSLCVFGEEVTPNQHKLVRDFVLLDNTYCSGILSADGHQWSDTAFATDYMEKSFAGFPRSYPDGMDDDGVDALAYAPSGFLWDNAIAHGRSLRVYGEFAITETAWRDPARSGEPTFLDTYRDFIKQTGRIRISSRPAIESLRPYLNTKTVGWDMDIPDVFRAARFVDELDACARRGTFPNLSIICLPNDHTSGTREGSPTPAAQVADNDLAIGRIVAAISRSPFWKKTCIFAIEDDPQNGWDHVSGYRTTAYVVSPYTRRASVVHTRYNQTSLLRTIELILGLPPMNQMDATATAMADCFTATPDFTPYRVVPNRVPLDQMNPPAETIHDPVGRQYARLSARLPLEQVDRCPEGVLNRILWQARKGSRAPYPDWAVTGAEGVEDGDRATDGE